MVDSFQIKLQTMTILRAAEEVPKAIPIMVISYISTENLDLYLALPPKISGQQIQFPNTCSVQQAVKYVRLRAKNYPH